MDDLLTIIRSNDLNNLSKLLGQIDRSYLFSKTFHLFSDQIDFSRSIIIIPCSGLTLLHIAAYEDSLECFGFLHSHDFSLDIVSHDNYLPLHYALVGASFECLNYILEHDKQQFFTHFDLEYTLIHMGIISKNVEVLVFLSRVGVEIDASVSNDYIKFAIRIMSYDCLRYLLKHITIKDPFDNDESLLMTVIKRKQLEPIKLLIEFGADPYFISFKNKTALSIACFYSDREVVRLLCSIMDNIDLPADIKADGAVHWLCQSKDVEIAKIMLSKNIDVNRINHRGESGPFYLFDSCEEEVVIQILELLIKHGFDVNIFGPESKTTCLGSCVIGITKNINVIEYLIQKGANINGPLRKYETIANYILKIVNSEPSSPLNIIAQKYILHNVKES